MQPIERDNIRLAATVLLLRDGLPGLEVFMVKRPAGMVFPDLHVFPGGKVDDADHLESICAGIDDRSASLQLGLTAGGLRYWVAAIRECFEECGVLLATRDGRLLDLVSVEERERFSAYRLAVTAGQMSMAELCERENLLLACDQIHYFSHWLTPDSVPKRFDTRFFATTMPHGQQALADTDETADSDWVTPAEALRRRERSEWQMIHSTFMTLMSIASFPTVEDALTAVIAEAHLPEFSAELNRQGMQRLR